MVGIIAVIFFNVLQFFAYLNGLAVALSEYPNNQARATAVNDSSSVIVLTLVLPLACFILLKILKRPWKYVLPLYFLANIFALLMLYGLVFPQQEKKVGVFDPFTVQVGNTVGKFVVSDIARSSRQDVLDGKGDVHIVFVGKATLEGRYDVGTTTSTSSPSIQSGFARELPHVGNPYETICLAIPSTVQWTAHQWDLVKVVISRVEFTWSPNLSGCEYKATVVSETPSN